jgi:hypothetical protein
MFCDPSKLVTLEAKAETLADFAGSAAVSSNRGGDRKALGLKISKE